MKTVVNIILIFIVMFLMFTFVTLEICPFQWSLLTRAHYILFSSVASILYFLWNHDTNESPF